MSLRNLVGLILGFSCAVNAQAVPDLSMCNGQTACSVSSTLNASVPFVLAWAQNYFSSPVHVTLFAGPYSTDLQKQCRTVADKQLQDWTITADKALTGAGLGYMYLMLAQSVPQTQDVFFRFSSDSTTPLGNCIIVTKPIMLLQSSSLQANPNSNVPPGTAPLPITPAASNAPNQTGNVVTNAPPISDNLTIIIACSIAAAVFALLILLFILLIVRRRRNAKNTYLNESLVSKNGSSNSVGNQSITPSVHQIAIPTPLLVDPFLDNPDIKRAETKLHIVDAHLIAETFRKELSDPLASNGWDANSAGSGGNIIRGNSLISHTSSNISPVSHLGLDRII